MKMPEQPEGSSDIFSAGCKITWYHFLFFWQLTVCIFVFHFHMKLKHKPQGASQIMVLRALEVKRFGQNLT